MSKIRAFVIFRLELIVPDIDKQSYLIYMVDK